MYDHQFIQINGLTLHTVMAGPADGPPVVLLHGFPEFWYGWRKQIPALAEAGFRVLAPDQRGYNLSDKPKGIPAYRVEELARDILGLIDAAGYERVHLVGHDWGAYVAWWIAMTAPERLNRLAILNVPHPHVSRRRLLTDPHQMAQSTYVGFFQIPWLPEVALSVLRWRVLSRALSGGSLPGAFTDEDLDHYRQAWSKPGAISAMLNWYRAEAQQPAGSRPPTRITVPTTIIWGKKDAALRSVMAEESAALCDRVELIWQPENTHWVQHEAAATVNQILIDRFSAAG